MNQSSRRVAGLIRHQLGSETNARFLRSLPAFRVEREIPASLQQLLEKLEQAEGREATGN